MIGDSTGDFWDDAIGGDDILYGGYGNDTLWGDTSSEMDDDSIGGDDILSGGDGDDTLVGDAKDIFGSAIPGDDILNGGAGDDDLYGDDQGLLGGGEDTFAYNASTDQGDDIIFDFYAGEDILQINNVSDYDGKRRDRF